MVFPRRTSTEAVQSGDVFRKVGTYSGVWVVERIFEYPDIPPHVRLVERTSGRAMTVAASILSDPDHFTVVVPGESTPTRRY